MPKRSTDKPRHIGECANDRKSTCVESNISKDKPKHPGPCKDITDPVHPRDLNSKVEPK